MEKETLYIGYANQKGGCGKTTLTQLTVKALAAMGKEVLVIECDKQNSLFNVIDIQKENDPNFTLPYKIVNTEVNQVGKAAEEAFGKYDFVFIDMPGTLDKDGIVGMLSNADILLIPFVSSQYDLDSSLGFIEAAKKVKAFKAGNNLPFSFYAVINKDKPNTKESKELKGLLEELKIERFENVVKDSVNYVRHQSNFIDPLSDKNIKFEFGKFIDEFMEKADAYREEIKKLETVSN